MEATRVMENCLSEKVRSEFWTQIRRKRRNQAYRIWGRIIAVKRNIKYEKPILSVFGQDVQRTVDEEDEIREAGGNFEDHG